jgi:UPF0042 nucleotide-binding protein
MTGTPPQKKTMRLVIVTGVSGAGKSTALKALEDVGFYCVDNMPLPLLPRFVELLADEGATQAALGVDARAGEFLSGYSEMFRAMRTLGHQVEVLFLDASDDVLVRRFSETRRRHPLAGEDLREGIVRERDLLRGLREEAGAVTVDTANLNVHQLKGVIQERYRRSADVLGVTLLSFGFKHGLPAEADVVLDVRFLPNPYFVEALSASTGEEAAVASFVLDNADAREFLERAESLLTFLLPRAEREGKAYLTIAVGCTGGRHRSVAVVQELARRLPKRFPLTVRHRDLARRGHE